MSANTGPPPRRVYSTGSMDPENENYGYEDEYGKTSGSNGMNGYPENMDHSAHELFVEMDELVDDVWVEKSRWIKYEEQLDMERGVWNKPQVANISYQSITSLRNCIENSEMMLDLDARDFPQVVKRIVDRSKLGAKEKAEIQKVLMFRHKHVNKHGLMTRSQSLIEQQNSKLVFMAGKKEDIQFDVPLSQARGDQRKESTINCVETENEATSVLVGSINVITKPMTVIVRLNQAIKMPKTTEVSLPVRFIYIGFTPVDYIEMDPYEMGRAIGTLMSNKAFHTAAYKTKDKKEIFDAMDIFLNQTIILPPGDWDRRSLLPMAGMIDMRKKLTERGFTDTGGKGTKLDKKIKPDENDAPDKKMEVAKRNPLQRTKMPFGGLIDDIRYRYPLYLSDIKDGLNAQCVAATIFIYFACLSGAIAFGGLMGTSTGNLIGISETIIVSSVSGLIFSLFAGCPLIITGVTGPVLLYDQALYSFCQSSLPDKFLPWRFWIGMWTFVISLVVAGFQGSTLVRYFTRFTKDIFNALVALLFIVSAFEKLGKIFGAHPLAEIFWYCDTLPDDCLSDIISYNSSSPSCSLPELPAKPKTQPNTALLSMFLMFGTFIIAYMLRIMRTSHYFGRNVRKGMADFGVPIAIVIMVVVAYFGGDAYTEKLSVPAGISVTNSTARGWVISPIGNSDHPLPVWAMCAAFLPALLLYLLLFMETHICELIMMEKTKEAKGAGLHLDIVLLSLINFGCGVFGGPWICAATVRAVSHVSALTVMSTTNVPGETPKVAGIRDQRVSFTTVSILLGVSVALGPALKLVPFSVLFGVFLYMGVCGITGVQFFDRVFLCFMPVKHHPPVSYVQNVKTSRMVLFTVLQALGLVVLWVVKSISAIALAFPFFVVLMIPYRMSFKYIFSQKELDMLDGPQAGQNMTGEKEDEDVADFYALASDCPISPETRAPLHRGLLGLIQATTIIGELK